MGLSSCALITGTVHSKAVRLKSAASRLGAKTAKVFMIPPQSMRARANADEAVGCCWPGSVSQKRHRLQHADLEGLAAADVGARQFFIAPDHVRLRLGELGAVPFVGPPRQLRPLAPHYPGHLVLAQLAALGTGQRVGALFGCFVEKITLFHGFPALHPGGKTCSRNPGSLPPQRPKPESPEGTSTPAGLPSYSYLP